MRDQRMEKKGFTFVELIVLTLVVAIIGAAMTGTIIFFTHVFVYSPRQMDTQKIAQELMSIMTEGDQNVRGIRYARSVLNAQDRVFSYTYGYPAASDVRSVRFKLQRDGRVWHMYRSTRSGLTGNWSPDVLIPYYVPSEVPIAGRDSPQLIFTYRQAGDAAWDGANPNAIRRVIISIRVQTGSGSFDSWQGSCDLTSSVEIKGFS
jgi:type II secretory pathway pseudopilin PulG